MEMRTYTKSELARLYLAMRKLRRWIKQNPALDEALSLCHVSKNADFYSRKQVSLIVEYFDEP